MAIEDGNPLNFSGANLISIDDVKDLGINGNGLDTFTVTVEALNGATPYGSVQVTTGSGATISNDNTALVTISGTKAQVNAALNGLSYTPADNNVDATVTLKVTAKDQANGGTAIGGAGGELTDIKNILINVSGVNDAPVVTAPTSVIVTEDIQFAFAENSLKVDDPDDFGKPLKVTLTVGNGTLILGSTTGLTVTGSGATRTLQGKETDINAALNTLKYQGNSDYNTLGGSKDTLTIFVEDLGNSGTGGAKTTTKTVDITVTPVNDAPVVPGSASVTVTAVAEDSTNPAGINTFTLLNSKYSDIKDTVSGGSTATPLAGIAIYTNLASAAQGKWQYNTSGSWVDVPTTVSSTSALILPATADLRFLPNANFNGVPGNLRVYLSDGTGGLPPTGSLSNLSAANRGNATQWSTNPVSITTTISAVNDAPIAAGTASLGSVNEDVTTPPGATVTSLFTPTFSDSTDQVLGGSTANTLAGVAIVGNASTAAQGAWQYFNGTSWVAIANPTPGAALVIGAATELRFLPNADFNGTPGGLTVNLIDSSGTATTGNILDLTVLGTGGITPYSSATIPLTTSVISVNDAPNGADNAKTIAEDTSYTFAAIDFGFSNSADPTDSLSAVRISSLPTNGKLQLNGVDITAANVVVSLTDINSDKLKFIPDLNENGTPYGNFTFAVKRQ
ncbi:MAG: hypothetical protein HC781_03920 [Leptolyngbyaceae cyanobacterium CSU_1_4]|nr:hypothetical protein [Leptolyngbyaceae cyanobacterium CSU_1_4]